MFYVLTCDGAVAYLLVFEEKPRADEFFMDTCNAFISEMANDCDALYSIDEFGFKNENIKKQFFLKHSDGDWFYIECGQNNIQNGYFVGVFNGIKNTRIKCFNEEFKAKRYAHLLYKIMLRNGEDIKKECFELIEDGNYAIIQYLDGTELTMMINKVLTTNKKNYFSFIKEMS